MMIPILLNVELDVEDVSDARRALSELLHGLSEYLVEDEHGPLQDGMFEQDDDTVRYESQADFATLLPVSSDPLFGV